MKFLRINTMWNDEGFFLVTACQVVFRMLLDKVAVRLDGLGEGSAVGPENTRCSPKEMAVGVKDIAHFLLEAVEDVVIAFEKMAKRRIGKGFSLYAHPFLFDCGGLPFW